jgi:hypothetical protein
MAMKCLIHMMPWFSLDRQNSHFTGQMFENDGLFLFDRYAQTGRVAAWYTPLIGPYSSTDPDVVSLHLDLIKMTGCGIIFNWYGVSGLNDYGQLLEASDLLVEQASAKGIEWTLCTEDRTIDSNLSPADQLTRLVADWTYIRDEYIVKHTGVLRETASGRPYFQVFGPASLRNPTTWSSMLETVFPDMNSRPILQSTDQANGNAIVPDGSYLWPGWSLFSNNGETTLDHTGQFQQDFFTKAAVNVWDPVVGVAYPRFRDYYGERSAPGAVQEAWWGVNVDSLGTDVYNQGFAYARDNGAFAIQVATFNDFGEGTVIEPTAEEGFKWLLETQQQMLGTTNLAALEARVREYNQLKASTWRYCDAVPTASRVECVGASISTTADQCESELGCCWRETSTPGAPWCFQRATAPIETCPPAEVRDCDAQPLDRLCICRHDLDPSPPPPGPQTATALSTRLPWWVIIVAALSGVGASAIVCVVAFLSLAWSDAPKKKERVPVTEDA